MDDFKLYDAQENAFDAMSMSVYHGRTAIYNARGCDYEFDVASEPNRNSGEYGVIVYCFNSDGEQVWTGSTGISRDTRIIDAVRAARKSSNL